jgi:hypothetical protein
LTAATDEVGVTMLAAVAVKILDATTVMVLGLAAAMTVIEATVAMGFFFPRLSMQGD